MDRRVPKINAEIFSSKEKLHEMKTVVLNVAIEEIAELASKDLPAQNPIATFTGDSTIKISSTLKRVAPKSLISKAVECSSKSMVKKKHILHENKDLGLSHKLALALHEEGKRT